MRIVVLFHVVALSLAALVHGADTPPARIAFGSCAQPRVPQPVWASILKAGPELFIFSGDNIYTSGKNAGEFEKKYALLATNGAFGAVRAKTPILATWDDHDYGPNDAGVENPLKSAAKEAFLKFFQVPEDSPVHGREGVYDSTTIDRGGRRLQVVLLDTRWFRSALAVAPPELRFDKGKYAPNDDPSATVLGETQWAWLAEELEKPADIRILVSSIQFVAEQHGFEKWANFPRERARLLKLIRDKKAGGVIVISGDRHFAEISMMPAGAGALAYPLVDVTASALNQTGSLYTETNRYRLGAAGYGQPNFGVIEIGWTDVDPQIRVSIRDALDGRTVLEHSLKLSELKP